MDALNFAIGLSLSLSLSVSLSHTSSHFRGASSFTWQSRWELANLNCEQEHPTPNEVHVGIALPLNDQPVKNRSPGPIKFRRPLWDHFWTGIYEKGIGG